MGLAGQTTNQKKLSKGELASKFLAGVKGTQSTNQNNMLQTMMGVSHSLYGNGASSKKNADNQRKLVKSTSHLQIGATESTQQYLNGPPETKVQVGPTSGYKDIQALQNPTTLKSMHKTLSLAQLNQPHLQGSFLTNLQINKNHTQEDIQTESQGQIANIEARPDSKLSSHNRQTQSLSQGKSIGQSNSTQ